MWPDDDDERSALWQRHSINLHRCVVYRLRRRLEQPAAKAKESRISWTRQLGNRESGVGGAALEQSLCPVAYLYFVAGAIGLHSIVIRLLEWNAAGH